MKVNYFARGRTISPLLTHTHAHTHIVDKRLGKHSKCECNLCFITLIPVCNAAPNLQHTNKVHIMSVAFRRINSTIITSTSLWCRWRQQTRRDWATIGVEVVLPDGPDFFFSFLSRMVNDLPVSRKMHILVAGAGYVALAICCETQEIDTSVIGNDQNKTTTKHSLELI